MPFPSYSVSVEIDARGPLRMLMFGTRSEVREVCADALEHAALIMRDAARENVRNTFGRCGWRQNSKRDKERGIYPEAIKSTVNRRGLFAIIAPDTVSGSIHELGSKGLPGGVIRPKNRKWLSWVESPAMAANFTFKIPEAGGYRVFVKSVKIRPQPYLEPASRTALPAATEAAKNSILKALGA
jgi:hypothetical protein